jgi:hypothetical protein
VRRLWAALAVSCAAAPPAEPEAKTPCAELCLETQRIERDLAVTCKRGGGEDCKRRKELLRGERKELEKKCAPCAVGSQPEAPVEFEGIGGPE